MARLLSLLMMFALVLTNGAAVANTMCRHVDAQAHVQARQSADAGIASAAIAEETAEAQSSRKGALADAAAVQLAGFMVPSDTTFPVPDAIEPIRRPAPDAAKLASMGIRPLLEPPLA